MPDRGSSALCRTGTGEPVPGVWFCAAGRTDGWNPDRKLCDRAGAD